MANHPGLKGWCKIVDDLGNEVINLNGLQSTNSGPIHHIFSDSWRTSNEMALMEYFDLSAVQRDETWIHPAGGPSYLGRIIDRPAVREIVLHLDVHETDAALRESARAIRNQFEFSSNYIELGESSNDFMRFKTYPSPIPSPFNRGQLSGALITSQRRILDWALPIWMDPYPLGSMVNGSWSATLDRDHLPVI